jgi:hypothetical protein
MLRAPLNFAVGIHTARWRETKTVPSLTDPAARTKNITAPSVHVAAPLKAKTFKAAMNEDDDQKDHAFFKIAKVDESLGIVFGWAVICKVAGQDYYDWNIDHGGVHKGNLIPEHITEPAMLKSAAAFKGSDRPGNEMHEGEDVGKFLFAFPLTTDIAKAMGIACAKTGLMVGYQAPPAVLAKFKSGAYTGFSIEGVRGADAVEHD